MYGKLTQGGIEYAPSVYKTEKGSMIFNFNNNIELMKENGFKEIIDTPPECGVDEIYVVEGYTDNGANITVNYRIVKIEKSPQEEYELQMKRAMSMYVQTLADDRALEVPLLFDEFKIGVDYKVGERIVYKGVLYKVLSNHKSQGDWTPDIAHSLFAKVINETLDGSIPEWQQPDSTNPYNKGDRVKFEGKTYESLIDNNVWSPTAYPSGWKIVS